VVEQFLRIVYHKISLYLRKTPRTRGSLSSITGLLVQLITSWVAGAVTASCGNVCPPPCIVRMVAPVVVIIVVAVVLVWRIVRIVVAVAIVVARAVAPVVVAVVVASVVVRISVTSSVVGIAVGSSVVIRVAAPVSGAGSVGLRCVDQTEQSECADGTKCEEKLFHGGWGEERRVTLRRRLPSVNNAKHHFAKMASSYRELPGFFASLHTDARRGVLSFMSMIFCTLCKNKKYFEKNATALEAHERQENVWQ